MNYQQTIDYLYKALPMFQRIGQSAYKKDLSNTIALCEYLENPQNKFKSVHVAGTNGKGSTAHSIAAVLQAAGYKTGLYTSPHLKEFTERIKINGQEIEPEKVVGFVEKCKDKIEEIQPSFFEVTVAMAFDYFAREKVDIAVIEVGMGGRLDSTNVIIPEVSVITNISFDHQEILGNTLPLIASEKAGIIKPEIPVVISEIQAETHQVFKNKAHENESPIYFAAHDYDVVFKSSSYDNLLTDVYHKGKLIFENLSFDLTGSYQLKNLPGILKTLELLGLNFNINEQAIRYGLANVKELTGLKGRWQTLSYYPLTICDTGHNEEGVKNIVAQLKSLSYENLYMIIGMVSDKSPDKVLSLLPGEALYYFCQASIPRAMDAKELATKAKLFGIEGTVIPNVNEALNYVRSIAQPEDLIFIGGSTFVVAELDEL
jgi:dihydrofolate synthase / folylpolyglutamate synthase